ncbi:hypothetical protein AAGW05_04730 [Arthrobacter sp. LAPM80]|uniref:hypothetical protein n=1 Tax=Arthrobacter sp. LAPM80 TaxID=3141788 RepID=UPI00398B74F9
MSKPLQENPKNQQPYAMSGPADPLGFKLPGSILLLILGTLTTLASFAQALTNLIFAPWYLLVASLIGLALALAVLSTGLLMYMRRGYAERLTPLAALISTGALLVIKLAGLFFTGGGTADVYITVALVIPIFILVGRGRSRTSDLMPAQAPPT